MVWTKHDLFWWSCCNSLKYKKNFIKGSVLIITFFVGCFQNWETKICDKNNKMGLFKIDALYMDIPGKKWTIFPGWSKYNVMYSAESPNNELDIDSSLEAV